MRKPTDVPGNGAQTEAHAVAALPFLLAAALLAGCAALPPGSNFPKTVSSALDDPSTMQLGKRMASASRTHGDMSGFRSLPLGVDGYLPRAQMINPAERTRDLQYFILRGDETGQPLANAVLHAADCDVRVLVDDGETIEDEERIVAVDSHPHIEVRVFNPFIYRGRSNLIRGVELLAGSFRLDYRMHNTLMVADNAIALIS